jgi:hypothetical protein
MERLSDRPDSEPTPTPAEERKHADEALDDALENTFPASDPVTPQMPLHARRAPGVAN